uniref:G-protein coupled receptor 84-like n=1 Tax=Styela clava TaxID=7725 RepID=UPI0019396E7F|nr:G-protein coupled receptor 84-like [Styela clava]
MTNLTSEDLEERVNSIAFRHFGIAIGFWTIFIGSFGNMLTILTYVANKKLRTSFNAFLLNLAVIDFYTSTCMIPFNVAGYIQMEWPFGNDSFTARLQAFNYFCCGYTSVVFLVAITANRFIGAIFPGKYKIWFSKERMIWILIVCNICAPAFLLPFLVGTHSTCNAPLYGLTGYNTKQFLCTFICLPPNTGWGPYMQFTRVLFQFVPLIGMILMYAVIFTFVHKRRNKLTNKMGTMNNATIKGKEGRSIVGKPALNKTKSQRSIQAKRRSKEDSRMLVISVVICVAFMITFLPSVIVNLLPNRREIDVRWHMAASNMSWFNSSLNPIIYVILNRRFRREYWRIIQIAIGRVREKFVHDSSSTIPTPSSIPRNSSAGNVSESLRVANKI